MATAAKRLLGARGQGEFLALVEGDDENTRTDGLCRWGGSGV